MEADGIWEDEAVGVIISANDLSAEKTAGDEDISLECMRCVDDVTLGYNPTEVTPSVCDISE